MNGENGESVVFGSAKVQTIRGSGPLVAWVFQRLLAATFAVAWVSLFWQIDVLVGSRGLLPIRPLLDGKSPSFETFLRFPTLFWWGSSDFNLRAGCVLGIVFAALAFCGFRPRLCFAISTLLYLSYATICRTFLSFQWDNLLLECGFLAVFLSSDRPARWVHVLYRILLFKLYFESGVAKWQSYLRDWHDGSAMTFYYETAPLPTWLAWYAHNLPAWWHHFESRATLALELLIPLAFFAPRKARLTAFAAFTGFQLINLATANYGFFVYLSLALHVFLLDDRDFDRIWHVWLPHVGSTRDRSRGRMIAGLRSCGAGLVTALYFAVSLVDALGTFGPRASWQARLYPIRLVVDQWRLVNTYHLFGHITRDRFEPEFQTFDGQSWTAHHLHHKPGDPRRAPNFVAPHQPRVDFQLWFYGLSFHQTPEYVANLVERLCSDPDAVQPLFRAPLPVAPSAVRIVFWRYRFTTALQRKQSGEWWRREMVAMTQELACRRR